MLLLATLRYLQDTMSYFHHFLLEIFLLFLQIPTDYIFFSWKLYSWCCHSRSFSFLFNLHDAAKNSIQKGSLSFTLHQGEHRPTVYYVLEVLWDQHINLNHSVSVSEFYEFLVEIGPNCMPVTLFHFFYNSKSRYVKNIFFQLGFFCHLIWFILQYFSPTFEKGKI